MKKHIAWNCLAGLALVVGGIQACSSSDDSTASSTADGGPGASPSGSTPPGDSAPDPENVPTMLKTVVDGAPINAPARNTIFVCPRAIPDPTRDGGTIPFPTQLKAAKTAWVKNGMVDLSVTPNVKGAVTMNSVFNVTETATERRLKGNGIPNHPVGTFPIPKDQPAYAIYAALPAEGYANAAEIPVMEYDLDVTVTRNPVVNKDPSCMGPLATGVTLTGATWHFEMAADNQLNLLDPNAALATDDCSGHPYMMQYHYHGYSWKCFKNQGPKGQHSPLFGYALDGFGVYGPRGEDGKMVKNDQLDECHGHTGMVEWEGKMTSMYHYHLNNEYPYSIGCFRGTPAKLPAQMMN